MSPELVFLQLDSHIWGWWETVKPEACCLCPVYSIILFWLLSLQKNPFFTETGCWKWKQAFQCFCDNIRIFLLDFNPEHREIWSHAKQTIKATSSSWSSSSTGKVDSPGIHKWVVGPFLPSSGVFHGWEVMLTLLWKLRQVLMHQLGERGPGLVSFKISANVWNMSKILLFSHYPHNSSWALNAASLSADLNTVVILPCSDRLNSLSRLNMSHK